MSLLSGRGKSKNQEGYGRGVAELDIDDDVFLDEDELTARLIEIFQNPFYEPPTLPSVAVEISQLSQRPDVKIEDIVSLLEQDSMLTGRIMKTLQSPIYKPASGHALSLQQSIARIGLNALRDIVLQTAMNLRVFKCEAYGETMELLRKHSTLTAHLSKMICRHTNVEADYAFLCGLLHDVGTAGSILALAEAKTKTKPDLISIWPTLDRVHELAGKHMIGLWKLPEEIQNVVGAHHQVLIGGEAHPLAAVICIADDLAHEFGGGLTPDESDLSDLETSCLSSYSSIDRSGPKTLEHARNAIGLDEPEYRKLRGEAKDLVEEVGL